MYVNFLEILFSGHEEILMDHFIPLYGFIYSTSREFFSGNINEEGNFTHTASENEISDCHIITFHILSGMFKKFQTESLAVKLGKDFAPCFAQLSSPESIVRKYQLKTEIYQLSEALAGKWQLLKSYMQSGNQDYHIADDKSRYFNKSECIQTVSSNKISIVNKTGSWLGRNVSRLMYKARKIFNRITKSENSTTNPYHGEKFAAHLIPDFPYMNKVMIPAHVNRKPKNQRKGKMRIFSHLTYFLRNSNHEYKMTEIKKQISSG